MTPKIIEIENGRLKLTPECWIIEELKDIIDKYDMNAEPYILYVYYMAAFDSPYRNMPDSEKKEAIITDIHVSLKSFDEDDALLEKAIQRLKDMYSTPLIKLYNELEEELLRLRYYLQTTPISTEDLSQRTKILMDAGKLAASFAQTKKQIQEDTAQATRGDQQTGGLY